jgi:hypothetical protein
LNQMGLPDLTRIKWRRLCLVYLNGPAKMVGVVLS